MWIPPPRHSAIWFFGSGHHAVVVKRDWSFYGGSAPVWSLGKGLFIDKQWWHCTINSGNNNPQSTPRCRFWVGMWTRITLLSALVACHDNELPSNKILMNPRHSSRRCNGWVLQCSSDVFCGPAAESNAWGLRLRWADRLIHRKIYWQCNICSGVEWALLLDVLDANEVSGIRIHLIGNFEITRENTNLIVSDARSDSSSNYRTWIEMVVNIEGCRSLPPGIPPLAVIWFSATRFGCATVEECSGVLVCSSGHHVHAGPQSDIAVS
jgi:hypothetical protein